MTTQKLIEGITEIEKGIIPLECIIDMAPEIIEKLKQYQRLSAYSKTKNEVKKESLQRTA